MDSKRLACGVIAAMLLLSPMTDTAAAQSKFYSSQETGGAPGRYRVELELRSGDDLTAISSQLAATYGARVEPYAEAGFSGFAIIATPTCVRLMSSDPRVVAIVDLNEILNTDPPRDTAPAEPVASVQTDRPALATEQVRTTLTSEAVPGLGNYSYDGSGNVTSIDNHVFRYDAFGRLQNAFLGSFGSQAYTYDRYGNIMKIVTNGDDVNAARMSVDPETNQMDLPFSPSNPANMIATYDDVGNVITHNGSFVYDALNVMKETTDTARRLHVYSASDERVMVVQVANGIETTSEWTLRDGGSRVLRRLTKDSAGVWHWKEDYIYGGSQLLAAEVPGPERVRHFHVDHLGTPRLITGNGGVRIAEKTYAPFGRKVSTVTDDFEQLEFTGHERDTPSLDYMHARYYQPDLARFLSVDPKSSSAKLSRPQTWNRYSYALNSPINYVDPNGEEPNKAQAGTAAQFVAVVRQIEQANPNLTPGQVLGQADSYLRMHADDPGNSRYVYTSGSGWVDSKHFFAAANTAMSNGEVGTNLLGLGVEITQAGDPSFFSYEDLGSNAAGADFADDVFFPEGSPLSGQVVTYLNQQGAQAPTTAPNWSQLPGQPDQGGSSGRAGQSTNSQTPGDQSAKPKPLPACLSSGVSSSGGPCE